MDPNLFKKKLDALTEYIEVHAMRSQDRTLVKEEGGIVLVQKVKHLCSKCSKETDLPIHYKNNNRTGNHWLGKCLDCKRHFTS